MPDAPGFKVNGAFYPWIGFDDWYPPDCRLARLVTGYNETELLRGKASPLLVNLAFAAVAFRRANPGLTVQDAADMMDGVSPSAVEAVGFAEREADARPPDETTPGSDSSESGTPSSAESQATDQPTTSGSPLTPTGSA